MLMKAFGARLRACVAMALLTGALGSAAALAGPEPAEHKGYVRDLDGKIVAVSRGAKQNNAEDLKASKFGAFDVVSQICFGGSYLSGITAANLPNYTFSASASWNETSFTLDDGMYNYNPVAPPPFNKPRTVDNWTRAWREGADRQPAKGMKDLFNIAQNGDNTVAPNIARDRFLVGGQGKETPVYGSTNAAADARKIGDAANMNGKRYAVLVSWDKDPATDRHAVNIDRAYDTLRRVYGIPANQIAVLHADGAGNNLGPYINTDMTTGMKSPVQPSWPTEPLNMAASVDRSNTRQNWQDALAGKLFNGGAGADITADDSILVYNTGHGGHTGTIEKGLLGQKDAGDNPISVRYIIPDADNFFRNIGLNLEHGGNVQNSYLPNNLYKAQLSFDAALNLAGVKVSFDGSVPVPLADGTDFPAVPLDPLVDGNLQHFRFANIDAQNRVMGGATVIDLYNVPAALLAQLGGKLMTAGLLNAGDQEYVSVVTPAPGGVLLVLVGAGAIGRRRTRSAA